MITAQARQPASGIAYLIRLFIVVVLAAAGAALIVTNYSAPQTFSALLQHFRSALIYSCCISILAATSLSYLGHTSFAWRRGMSLLLPIGVLFVVNIVGCLAAAFFLALFGIIPYSGYWQEFSLSVRLGTVITLVFGLSMYFYQTMLHKLETANLELRTREMKEERAHKLLAEARLSSLESRIHPHFLFNTLNSIASLIPKDPRRAEDLVGKLASLLRFSLNANQNSLAPLGQEIKIVRDFLEIEKARFGDRLRYSIDVPEHLEALGVPPLSVESLVENSIKHVVAQRPRGGEIRVTARVAQDRIHLEVQDDGPGFTLDGIPPGHGLDNLSARLALLFGPATALSVARDGAYSAVRISLPANGARKI